MSGRPTSRAGTALLLLGCWRLVLLLVLIRTNDG